jgi:hypothetical protein
MKTKVILALLIAFALVLPACSADGGMIVPPYVWNNVQQTQQVAVMDVDMEEGTFETSIFISLQDLTDESHTVRWVIPLEEMPEEDSFNVVKMTFGDFMSKHDISGKRYDFEELEDIGENIKDGYKEGLRYVICIFNSQMCRYYYYPMPLMRGGAFGAVQMETAEAISPIQITYYGSTLLEVFNTTSDTDLTALFQQVGVSEELAAKYDKYKGKYFYITFMQTTPLLAEEPLLKTYCPTAYSDILNYIQNFERDEYWGFWSTQEMYTDQCIQEAGVKGNWTEEDKIRDLVWDLFDSVVYAYEGDIAGVEVTFKHKISAGEELYYPLGTGDLWSEPIGNIEIYADFPKGYSIDHDERFFYDENKVYKWQYEDQNPSEDILLEVKKKGEGLGHAKQSSMLWLSRHGNMIPVLIFLLSWFVAALWFMWPKKKKLSCKEFCGFERIAEAFLLFGIFFVPTYIVSSALLSEFSMGAPIAGFAAMWYYFKRYKKEKKPEVYKKPAKILGGAIGLFIVLYYAIKFLLNLLF